MHNPAIPGFNPDPSVVLVDGVYYAVTSSFEYLPGLPIYRSLDLATWDHIGNVVDRPGQLRLETTPASGGAWAPTIRFHDGLFYVIVTSLSPEGCVLFTAADPAGPWDDGTTLVGIEGIDPDLAWDDEGNALVTFSGLFILNREKLAAGHAGILQAKVDLSAGRALEEPRSLWSGTGLTAPEGPHLYQVGDHWYLVIAEGGTERGHTVSVARGSSPYGPFEDGRAILSAKGTDRPIQNTGHADLVQTPDGGWALVLLGVRAIGRGQSFSPLGRETFITPVAWVDGWPVAEPVMLNPSPEILSETFDFGDGDDLSDPGWVAVRALPGSHGTVRDGHLVMSSDGDLRAQLPTFVGRRQRHFRSTTTTVLSDASSGSGGLVLRYDEQQWLALEARGTTVAARASLAGIEQSWSTEVAPAEVVLRIDTAPSEGHTITSGGDSIKLFVNDELLIELDGRYWSAETCASFTGRVVGVFCSAGDVRFRTFSYTGCDGVRSAT